MPDEMVELKRDVSHNRRLYGVGFTGGFNIRAVALAAGVVAALIERFIPSLHFLFDYASGVRGCVHLVPSSHDAQGTSAEASGLGLRFPGSERSASSRIRRSFEFGSLGRLQMLCQKVLNMVKIGLRRI